MALNLSRLVTLVLILPLLLAAGLSYAQAMTGVALVIGQSDYRNIPALPNPANDAREMVKLLTDLGFDARGVTDRDAGRLKRDLDRFVEDAEGADVALLYYSGHGIEAGGDNWLLPVDTDSAALENAGERLVSLSDVLDQLKATVPVTIVLLDACRTNPFPKGTVIRNAPRQRPVLLGDTGLGAVRGATSLRQKAKADRNAKESLGVVIGFAAEPGLPALDGDAGSNSPYAKALMRHLAAMQGVEFGSVMRMVTEEVYLSTGAQQRPWVNESLRRLLYFGMAPDEPEGPQKSIEGERRTLLLSMADLPSVERLQVEKVALREGVRMDSLYGILRALGQDRMPQDPKDLDTLLSQQAGRLREMMGQRAALRTDNPEIAALSAAADRAIAEGAIQSARKFLDEAVARVEGTSDQVDDLEAALKAKRLADAAVYAKRADASALAFAFRAAADDYAKAFDLVARWDETLAWNYKNLQAEALRSLGAANADATILKQSLDAYQQVLNLLPNGEKGLEWARTRNNMAVVLNTMGERETGTENLEAALAMFRETMDIFAAGGEDLNWAAAQNNIGNIQLELGNREGSSERLQLALKAYRSALAKRDRKAVPLSWASTQNNIGIATYNLARQRPDLASLEEAEAAYRAALSEMTKQNAPADWSMVQNNLGNTLNALGLKKDDPAFHRAAAKAFEEALSMRAREQWPFQFAMSQLNLGNAYSNLARHETGTTSLEKARASYDTAMTVFDRDRTPLDWASAVNNLGVVLQTLGQRGRDAKLLSASIDRLGDALTIYTRERFPQDWAMAHNNRGNTLLLRALVAGDGVDYERAAADFREALKEYQRARAPMNWALATASLGSALQSVAMQTASAEALSALRESIALRRAALEVLTPENAPVDWANAQNGLGVSLLNLSTREQNTTHLAEAANAFEESTKIFTRAAKPVQWAFAQNNIGDVHWGLASGGGGVAQYRLANERFEMAKAVFVEAGFQSAVPLLDNKMQMITEAIAKGGG